MIWLPLFSLLTTHVIAQHKFTLSGEVRDAVTGESLIGAVISAKDQNKGVVTNLYGFFSLTLTEGEYTIDVSVMGYETQTLHLMLNNNLKLSFDLQPKSYQQQIVVIEGNSRANTQSTDIGKIELEVDQIKKLPVLLGEVDILKTISLLPGVQSAGEGNAGFYVRGGGIDQNLILLDNSTVYNASHLFGFFSVFNADAIKNLELTKGGMPANYGGRIASVLDINLKEGNAKAYHSTGGIGTVASRFTIEGPIIKDTSSFIISGRRTYIDALLKPFINPQSNFKGSGYYFYDLNTKFNYRFSKRDQLFVSGYFGRDVFSFSSASIGFKTRIPWGNATATLRWNHVLNDKLFQNIILTFTDYKFQFSAGQENFTFGLKSGIRDYGAKAQWSYYPDYRHSIRMGIDYTFHDFTPNNTYASSGDTPFDLGPIVHLYSHETAAYLMDEWDVSEDFRIHAGLRISHFIHIGPFDRYIHTASSTTLGQLPEPEIHHYEKGKKIKSYSGLEPRLNIRYSLRKNTSLKLGFMRNMQYIHLTSLSPSSLPTDIWLPSTDVLKPQTGWQLSLGYFQNFDRDQWETSVEVYYKDMRHQSEYREGAQPQQTIKDNIDNLLLFGRGYSYGAEFFLKKRTGKINGWIGYTWAKTERIFDAINNGHPFPARWDRRHDLNLVANYTISKRIELGFVFVYGTGNAITLPLSRYFIEGRVVDVYGQRNSFRMASYHRADISCTLLPKKMKKKKDKSSGEWIERPKKFNSSWNFSIYNLYNRKNPYFIYFGTDGNLSEGTLQIKAYQVSLFPILPSITWNFEF